MATLLDLTNKLVQNSIQFNLYSSNNEYKGDVSKLISQSTPVNQKPLTSQIDVNKRDDLKNNLYNDGPISLINGGKYALNEGFIGPLRNFDIFAIAHWFRNVRW